MQIGQAQRRDASVSVSVSAKLNLSPPLFSADASRVAAAAASAPRSVGRPAAVLPLLPRLLLAQTVGSAVRPATIPIRMCSLRRTNAILVLCRQLALLVFDWHVYLERRARIGAGSRLGCSEQ